MNQKAAWEKSVNLYWKKEHSQNQFWSISNSPTPSSTLSTIQRLLIRLSIGVIWHEGTFSLLQKLSHFGYVTSNHCIPATWQMHYWYDQDSTLTTFLWKDVQYFSGDVNDSDTSSLFHWVLSWDSTDCVSFAMEETFCTYGAVLQLQNQQCQCESGSSSPPL